MIKIGICDDDEKQRKYIIELCKQYQKESGILCELYEFSDGEDILKYKGERLTLLLLDIEMEKINGIEVMKKLEYTEQIWRIVFISAHQEQMIDTFGIKTLQFGIKPIYYQDMKHWIEIAVRESREEIIIKLKDSIRTYYFPMSDIIYLQAEGSYTIFYTNKGKVCISKNIKYWEKCLPGNQMVRCHKSYVVNLEHICQIKQKIKMEIQEIPIGRKYGKELNEKYNMHLMNKLRGRVGKCGT